MPAGLDADSRRHYASTVMNSAGRYFGCSFAGWWFYFTTASWLVRLR